MSNDTCTRCAELQTELARLRDGIELLAGRLRVSSRLSCDAGEVASALQRLLTGEEDSDA